MKSNARRRPSFGPYSAAEEDARRWVAYERAKAERDKLVEELARVYPPIADQLADLAARLATNDAQLEIANRHARPAGAEHLRSAEEIARALTRGFGVLGTEIPRITRDCLRLSTRGTRRDTRGLDRGSPQITSGARARLAQRTVTKLPGVTRTSGRSHSAGGPRSTAESPRSFSGGAAGNLHPALLRTMSAFANTGYAVTKGRGSNVPCVDGSELARAFFT
jgi:hypothetical protein